MDKLFNTFLDRVEHDRSLPMQRRLYQLICLTTSILCFFVIIPVNLFLNLHPVVNIAVALLGLASFLFYWRSRRGKDYVILFFVTLMLVLDIVWFPNYGSQGSIIYYFAAAVIYPMALLRGKARWIMFASLVMNAFVLLIIEHLFPSLSASFSSPSDRLYDLLTGVLCSSLAGAMSLWVVITSYDQERDRILHISKELAASEKNYRDVVENTNTIILRVDRQGTVLFFNAFAEFLLGYKRDEIMGTSIFDTIFPRTSHSEEPPASHMERIIAAPDKYPHFESWNQCSDNRRVWISWTIQPIYGENLEAHEILCVGANITEQKKMEDSIKSTSLLLHTILDNTPAIIYVKDRNLRYELINRQYERIFHISAAAAQGRTDHDIFPATTADTFQENDRIVLEQRKAIQFDETALQDGEERSYLSVKFPLLDANGSLRGLCGISTDVTERKLAEDRLRRSLQHLDLHVRQTPLAVIDWNLAFQVMDWNSSAEAMFGFSRDEVLGRYAIGLVFPEHAREQITALWGNLVANKGGRRSTIENVTRSGSVILCEWFNTPLIDDRGNVIGVTSLVLDISERKRAEEALIRSEKRFRDLLDKINLAAYMLDTNGAITYCNDYLLKITGWSRDDVHMRNWFDLFIPEQARKRSRDLFDATLANGTFLHSESVILTRTGQERLIAWDDTMLHDLSGNVVGAASIGVDITEKRKLEEQLRQAQKMEAIGHLAGGVAHDFNNILTAIIGYGNLLKLNLPATNPAYAYAEHILASSERAANLTNSLLAYSRKQVIAPRPADISGIVMGIKRIVERIIGEDIEITVSVPKQPVIVLVDRSQIEQVLMNLVTNARDAMPRGGHLEITVDELVIDDGFIQAHQFGRAGRYARMSVTDTGIGMDERTRSMIFDPFFTTKEVGKGTGLGLAMVYGTITQHGGFIDVSSTPGEGTKVMLYVPCAVPTGKAETKKASPLIPSGNEVILLIEDDDSVRTVTRAMLEQLGYTVLEARDGDSATTVFRQNRNSVQLVIADIIMPRKNGKEVYEELLTIRPDIKVLFVSGYTADVLAQKGIAGDGLNFIAKPFKPEVLSVKIREVLGASS